MPLTFSGQQEFRFRKALDKVRAATLSLRNIDLSIRRALMMIKKNPSIFLDVKGLPQGDYVTSSQDSPTREELLDALRALLSYAYYGGYLSDVEYSQITGGETPAPPEQISILVDSIIE